MKTTVPTDYAEAKAISEALDKESLKTSRAVNDLKDKSGAVRGSPASDDLRADPEYQEAKSKADKAFRDLQSFNQIFVRRFKKEMAEERKQKTLARQKKASK